MHCAGWRIFNQALITVITRVVVMIYIAYYSYSECVVHVCILSARARLPSHCVRFKGVICCMRCVRARLATPSAAQIEHFSFLTSVFSHFVHPESSSQRYEQQFWEIELQWHIYKRLLITSGVLITHWFINVHMLCLCFIKHWQMNTLFFILIYMYILYYTAHTVHILTL